MADKPRKSNDLDEIVAEASKDITRGSFDSIPLPGEGGKILPPRLKSESKIAADDFYEAMLQPDAPNEMAFQIDRDKPNDPPAMTFSQEAINEIAEQFRMFLMARTFGEMKRTGLGPRHLRAVVKLDWHPGDPLHDPEVGPFYSIDNDGGLEPIDSTRRDYAWRKP